MITAHLPYSFAADDEGSSDSGSSDNGDDGGSKDDSGDNSGDSAKEEKTETSDESDNSDNQDTEVKDDLPGDVIKNSDELKGTPEEQEKAAVEDHIADQKSDSELPKVIPKWKPTSKNTFCANKVECDKLDHPEKYPLNNPYHPKYCDKWNHECKPKIYNCHGWKCDPKIKCHDWMNSNKCGSDGKHDHDENDKNCHHWWSNWNCHRHHPNHHHDNDNHRDSHHTHTSTSGGHGDLTVIVNIDHYNTKSSSKLKDFNLRFDIAEGDGDNVYNKHLDLSSMPDQIKVDHLDIDQGDVFLVSLTNNIAEDGDSYLATSTNNDKDLDVFLTAE